MSENKAPQLTSISQAQTLEEIGAFWDTHSLDDYWDQTHEVAFEMIFNLNAEAQSRRARMSVRPPSSVLRHPSPDT